ncbi:putative Na+-dependent transporter [Leptolyngbya sp. PCC 6406]|uniref:putative Na+-dependent transporter n=1 Tax=Leptolyngbya sp. PCC 6406 TaxID=1173264 RepID=UPI0002AC9F0C|nr:putative Na+-dependent transporter [Leptolyngbya sp. PCC 6406]
MGIGSGFRQASHVEVVEALTRSLCLFGSMALGILLPQGHGYAFLIRHLLMVILFLSLLDLRIDHKTALSPRLGPILAMMMALSGLAAWVGHWFSPDLALVAFLLAMAPTAAAAPVMTEFLQGRVDYVMASVVVTSIFSAIVLPLALPLLSPQSQMGFDLSALVTTLTVILVPLGVAQLLRRLLPMVAEGLLPLKRASFYLWMLALYLATARATFFIEVESDAPLTTLIPIALVSLALCTVNFSLGRWLGGYEWGQEMGQSLGQKNTLFTIWICLTFLTPAIALGPMFYILFQNLYNSYLLAHAARQPG